jgi:hypothetical protein
MASDIKFRSIFTTKDTDPVQVSRLIETGVPAATNGTEIDWKAVDSGEIKYSRAWLIIRRAWLEQFQPELLIKLPAATGSKDDVLFQHGKVIRPLREDQLLSWGEIAVRVGMAESYCRKAFDKSGVTKAVGLRIGKGGRFAYQDPTLYLEHRKEEGAMIPVTLKKRPEVADLLNATKDEPVAPAKAKAKATKTA